MGLGKTVQSIALLRHLFQCDGDQDPHIIIGPLSTLPHWVRTCKEWFPDADVVLYHDMPAERKTLFKLFKKESHRPRVLVTSYDICVRDTKLLRRLQWDTLIVDEAHRLKNHKSKLFVILCTFSSRFRVLLTGTPLQNNLEELWSLLNFIAPSVFQSSFNFEQWFNAPFDTSSATLTKDETDAIVERLHRVLQPFLLRRTKEEVVQSLPKKRQVMVPCPLSGLQRAIYTAIQDGYRDSDNKQRMFNNTLMQLRKVCSHPLLFAGNQCNLDISNTLSSMSGKFWVIAHMLPRLITCGHRPLLFFQMTSTMDLFLDLADTMGYEGRYLRLDGSTPQSERQRMIQSFNTEIDTYDFFLLSTRAGGLGINLQSSDTVVLFDSDWNPQADMQAQARAHRIGQKEDVLVLRLVTVGTVEERIIKRAQDKLHMEHRVLKQGRFTMEKEKNVSMSEEDLLSLPNSVASTDFLLRAELNAVACRDDEEHRKMTAFKDRYESKLDRTERIPSWCPFGV